jgi:hypothetical protein
VEDDVTGPADSNPSKRQDEAEIVVNGKTVGYGIEGMLNALTKMLGPELDMTLRCPVCARRADMCFDHGDDWKKRWR